MKTITIGNHVALELMLSQLAMAMASWTSNKMIRLQCLSYPSQPLDISPALGHALENLWDSMARHGQSLVLHLSACRDTLVVRHVLKRARQLGILKHLVLADRSLLVDSRWMDTLMFEILANPQLQTLELNCPGGILTTAPRDHGCCSFGRLGHAIAANPSIQTLVLYTYEDHRGRATTSLLQALLAKQPELRHKSETNGRRRQTVGLTSLQLYCPKTATSAIVLDGLVPLLRQPHCQLSELELTCIRHHNHLHSEEEEDASTDFPLKQLVQDGLLNNASLLRLGVFHADLTTPQVDQDLLCHLHKHPCLQYLDLFGNQVDSLYFPHFFRQSQHSCCLEELHLSQNPCLTQHPYQHYQYYHQEQHEHSAQLQPPFVAAESTTTPTTTSISLLDILHTLFQRHPCLYHFGVNPHAYFFTNNNDKSQKCPQTDALLFLTDCNRTGLRRRRQSPHVLGSGAAPAIDLPPLLPSGLWPRVLQSVTQEESLILHPQPSLLAQAKNNHPTRSRPTSTMKRPGGNNSSTCNRRSKHSSSQHNNTHNNNRDMGCCLLGSPKSVVLAGPSTGGAGWKTIAACADDDDVLGSQVPVHILSSSSPPLLPSSSLQYLRHGVGTSTRPMTTTTLSNLYGSLTLRPHISSGMATIATTSRFPPQHRRRFSSNTHQQQHPSPPRQQQQPPFWKKQSPRELELRRQRQASLLMEVLRSYPSIWTTVTTTTDNGSITS